MIDLHTHTTYSDGTLTPEKLIDRAMEKKLKAIAITDHDCTDGITPAIERAVGHDLWVIPGIEIEVDFYPREFHLLGLNLSNWTGAIKSAMEDIRLKRHERNLSIISKMNDNGWNIEYGDVKKFASSDLVARPHFAAMLVEKGIVRNTKQAFEKYLGMGRPFYVRKEALSLEKAVNLVSEGGGKPVIAHPLSLYLSWGKLPAKLEEIREAGVLGLEAWHPSINRRKAERLMHLAEKYDFFLTGGSDFHGDLRKDRQLGLSSDQCVIPDEYLDFLY
jgi:predicted metal-dependent phosphoesterase TrpH